MLHNFPHELTCQILTNQSIKLDVERDQRVILARKVISNWHVLPACKKLAEF